jgi:predicted phosphoribosyltransferase
MWEKRPAKIVVAVSVAALGVPEKIGELEAGFVWLHLPEKFSTVPAYYAEYEEVGDAESRDILEQSRYQSTGSLPALNLNPAGSSW